MKEERFLENARSVSLASDFPKARIGCVIAYKGQVIASGCNSTKTHSLQGKYNIYRFPPELGAIPSLHAETAAMVRFLNQSHRTYIDPKDCTVYVYREWRDGTVAMARPCKSCMAMLKELGFRRIVYTTFDGIAKEKITRE